jgi:hypothetical protein
MLQTSYPPAEDYKDKLVKESPKQGSWDLGWIHFFLIFQFVLQLLILIPQLGAIRVVMRTASFAISLLLLVWIPGKGIDFPAKNACVAAVYILLLQLFLNPGLNSFLAGLAQCALYLAIFAPLFWTSRLKVTLASFQSLVYVVWLFHTVSAIFGLLQVYFPGQFQPPLSTSITQFYGEDAEQLKITLADGSQVFRPMGLTDTPGGAARAGFFALILGVGLVLKSKYVPFRLAGIASSAIGLFCIYLSQVRTAFISLSVGLIILGICLFKQGDFKKLSLFISGTLVMFTSVFTWAVAVGGDSSLQRLLDLTAEDPATVYQQNRGGFLTHTIQDLIPQYPFGAGLGRWGMMNSYFGENNNPFTSALWSEIQWTGWILDGGVPFLLAYTIAMFFVFKFCWDIAIDKRLPQLNFWAAILLAYNFSILASMFSSNLLIGQSGLEFWLLNAALVMVVHREKKLMLQQEQQTRTLAQPL